jgi:cobalt-zinc-cadmium efflux system protein
MLRAAYGLLVESGRVFLEASPRGLDPVAIGNAMAAVTGVVEVHDLHVWEVTSGFPALSAHVLVDADTDCHAIRLALEHEIHERFAIEHTTMQVEHRHPEELLQVEVASDSEPDR